MSDTTAITPPVQPVNVVTTTTGTAPDGQGPGSQAALQQMLDAYLTQQLINGGNSNSNPLPSAPISPAPVVIQAPAAQQTNSGPIFMLTIVLAVLGAIGAVAYLADRNREKKKKVAKNG